MTPLERVLERLPAAKRSGAGWKSPCPGHDDRRPSLSITTGDDGRVLLCCHGGCPTEAILRAIGLVAADLFQDDAPGGASAHGARANGHPRRSTAAKPAPRTFPTAAAKVSTTVDTLPTTKPAPRTFSTAAAAIADLESRLGPRSAEWTYQSAAGEPVGIICRWDTPAGKTIRPVSRRADRWGQGGMDAPRPLYGLPTLAGATTVYVCEGEKAADAVRSLGPVATTSAHGSKSAAKTDWSPLAGKNVTILPDNDQAGAAYAAEVAGLLAKLTPAPTVRIVDLPGLVEKGDVVDWVAAHGDAAEPAAMRVELEAIVAAAGPALELVEVETPEPAERLEWRPFPVEVLPEPIRAFVRAAARAIGCDPAYVALPILASIAAAIGTARVLRLKRSWHVPSVLWCVAIGESGSAKSPPFKAAVQFVRALQRESLERYGDEMKRHGIDFAYYEKSLAEWKRDKKDHGEPPEKPAEPQAVRYVVSDTTVEALAPILLANSRGLLLARDELAGWLGSFDRYSGKGGADEAAWLSMHSAESITVDRKTGNPRTICVPAAAVSICGTIQPGTLARCMGVAHRESGLLARLLLACPPRRPKRWTEADIPEPVEVEMGRLFRGLYALEPETDEEGRVRPVVLGLTPEAKHEWVEWYNAHGQDQAEQSGDLAAAYSKLEESASRLALVFHCVRAVVNDPMLRHPNLVDAQAIVAGVDLAKWFCHEARRVYGLFSESDEDADRRRLVEWVKHRGGSATAREVQMGCRWLREAGVAERALEELTKAGYGVWRENPPAAKGGRPSRSFCLSTCQQSTKPLESRESRGFVDVDTVDALENDPEPAPIDGQVDAAGGRVWP
ncbi:MAG: YfjI family protein [Pirellulales bacterium]